MNRFLAWLKRRAGKIAEHDSHMWQVMTVGLWLASAAAAVTVGLGTPTGIGVIFDLIIYFTLHLIGFFVGVKLLAFVLTLLYLPLPRFFLGSTLYTGITSYLILYYANLGTLFSIIVAAAYALAAALLGLTIYFFSTNTVKTKVKLIVALIPILLLSFNLLWSGPVDSGLPAFAEDDGNIAVLTGNSPAQPGTHTYQYFTYGSGKDRHRSEFASDTLLLSTSVDASDYIDEWPWFRRFFWGFDDTKLPLNGRVWMPEGEGPFPLVLIVHGNHTMEHFSDAGYAYLGELLASRGFIAISVDQNFLNYSSWTGTPSNDMKLRAWVLMQHLLEIARFQQQPNNPFYQQVDLQNIALIGHSRGGQAAAMVADYTAWFADDPSVSGIENMGIEAVAALAPTHRVIEGRTAGLNDIYYLVLHGAQDGDVNSFSGDRQYARASFSAGSARFKASLYIGEANHSQFNTDWGRMDSSLPRGLFLNQQDTMDASQQRKIAKVYLSAFLETALLGNEDYLPLFKDYRSGANWLPPANYVSRFADGMFRPLTGFQRNSDKSSFEYGITVDADGFSHWAIEEATDRQHRRKGFYGVVLAWHEPSSYVTTVTESYHEKIVTGTPESLVISLTNLERDLIEDEKEITPPQIDVELKSRGNISVRLPLEQFMPLPEQIYTQYAWIGYFDSIMRSGKYEDATEPVFQTFILPIESFTQENPYFEPENITEVTLHFSAGPGKVMIDDIGFSITN